MHAYHIGYKLERRRSTQQASAALRQQNPKHHTPNTTQAHVDELRSIELRIAAYDKQHAGACSAAAALSSSAMALLSAHASPGDAIDDGSITARLAVVTDAADGSPANARLLGALTALEQRAGGLLQAYIAAAAASDIDSATTAEQIAAGLLSHSAVSGLGQSTTGGGGPALLLAIDPPSLADVDGGASLGSSEDGDASGAHAGRAARK